MCLDKKKDKLFIWGKPHIDKSNKCALNIDVMLKHLATELKYNIGTYRLNIYQTSTKQPQLIYG